jgi:hypothetical protein
MQFQVGSKVRLANYTGDDQIDEYYGQELEVIAYTPIPPQLSGYHTAIPNYELLTPDYHVISANEYELTAL